MSTDAAVDEKKPGMKKWGQQTTHILSSRYISSPYAYVHLELVTDGGQDIALDELMVMSYCMAALKQFLGLTGIAIPTDILKAQDGAAWIRIPREDLKSFSAAITAYGGTSDGSTQYILRMKRSSEWLGTIVGQANAEATRRRDGCEPVRKPI
ncbi:hypothetical protein AAL_07474 [Moelleriella libera RCEF 2490]|uniref:Ribonucleases P/MRP subunit Pop8-like domain-containing protein n=1 Tax=Moelleriella libera RCEF 2490 TaxID=1081109 RepID=A0A167XE19_9HYPO|nr:hypothetical protein AAL_07474 [Moelleriella libera RCEF 2490]